ncbi:FAD-binding oxidoreductase [Desulfonatronum thioautotrophicum]|uniref:FAD-binding oxidoreductase n=1 Tax=Desulfonatronum thioautotrophicum TaxID=617001 RepID=UPI0005EB6416|nr:FAD-binding oxidoreductase [Desulfonatronum thioautotrophicum]
MIPEDIRRQAAQCRHYAMCKIDYLGTGLCASGAEHQYVSHFPQGRMDLCDALARNVVPITEGLVEIAESCNLCGICDRQCYFVTGMRPVEVMKALKKHVREWLEQGNTPVAPPTDADLDRLREIVGGQWATNDPAILLTYANDPFPLAGPRMPRFVVLPGNRDEVAAVVRYANDHGIAYAVRGNGGSVFGFVFTDGLVLDMHRMKGIAIDAENWIALVEPGVTSFELQQAAVKHGFRVNTAEPAATVCGNIVCTGLFSTWSNAYGVNADTFVDMEFLNRDGEVFRLSDPTAPNVFCYEHQPTSSPGICTRASVRLHPMTDDEEGMLVPFTAFDDAVSFVRDLSRRRIGLALGVLGGHYLSTFMAPTASLALQLQSTLSETLGMRYAVFLVGDRFAREAVRSMRPAVIDAELFRMLLLGLPNLTEGAWQDLVSGMGGDEPAYELLLRPEMRPVLEAILGPSPENLAGAVDADLRDFFTQLYTRPEMTDMVWLNMFRILSSRMSRHKHMFAFLVYVPMDRPALIRSICDRLREIADAQGLENDFGFLTPLDLGKRGILEYDYYIDHQNPEDAERIRRAAADFEPYLEEISVTIKGVKWLKNIFSQGCARKEAFLYT